MPTALHATALGFFNSANSQVVKACVCRQQHRLTRQLIVLETNSTVHLCTTTTTTAVIMRGETAATHIVLLVRYLAASDRCSTILAQIVPWN